MKALSASIVVLAGMAGLVLGASIAHSDTQLFVCTVGFGVTVAGLTGWFMAIRSPDAPAQFVSDDSR